MQTYTIRLTGPAVADARIPVTVVRGLLAAVEDGARAAVRLRLEGRSVAKGPSPAWLRQVSDFALLSVMDREAGIRLLAPSLNESFPERFAQADLFGGIDPENSALGFLSDSLKDAVSGEEESDGFDDALLKLFSKEFGELLDDGIEAVELRNGRPDAPVVVVTRRGLRTVQDLYSSTPAPRRVRLAGWLDTIRYSDRAFSLKLESGRIVRGVLAEGSPELLSAYFGQLAVLSGTAHYRPSGSLLRVDAEKIASATPEDASTWGVVPEAQEARLDLRQLHKPQSARSGLAALIGTWPGDESDEEIFGALEDLS